MKIVFLALAIVVGLYLAHNYIQTGEIGLSSSMSETERELKRLEDRLSDAVRAHRLAGRRTAIGGAEGTSGAEAAVGDVRYVARELERVRQRASTEPERARVKALEQQLKEVKRDMGIR